MLSAEVTFDLRDMFTRRLTFAQAAICYAAMADTLKTIEGVAKVAADPTFAFAAAAQTVDASRKTGDALVNHAQLPGRTVPGVAREAAKPRPSNAG